ncbi:VWA domain-containing protein [Candidatus Pacearchaeota archaeon]|nr:VWA domain-containing protein [Candidatus Pacearchaeota archaeon]
MNISFLYPGFLLFLLLIPLIILIYFLSSFYNKKKAILFPNFEAVERVSGTDIFSKNFISLYFNIAIIFLIVVGISGAVIHIQANTSSYSFVIAIDNSGSMKAADIEPNRLEAAKSAAKNFADLLPFGVEVGVIGFSGDASVYGNMDNSKIRVKGAIDSIDFGEVQGTNIFNAVVAANKLLEKRKMKTIVLISDGQLNVGDTGQIIRYANRNNIIINTILAGTTEGGLTEWNTISKSDEDIMKSLAFNTDGKFFKVQAKSELENSFDDILKKQEREIKIDISLYLFIAALILICIDWWLFNFRFRTLP